jgi:hypothetical protein
MESENSFLHNILKELSKSSLVGIETEAFLRQHRINIIFSRQTNSSASWTLNSRIHLNSNKYSHESDFKDPELLSLLVHETRHLQQGPFTALSVYGELDAWQAGFSFLKEIIGSSLHPNLEQILTLPAGWSRNVLREAASLMMAYAPGYRINLLPLYPIHKEIAWWVSRKEPTWE